mmetsp:Transcript_59906/g.118812  ORF Transcript_59906/g.118812 Transcript_59906/m.118812 type:complete len:140 (+) Transcript_59906:51-470(+)
MFVRRVSEARFTLETNFAICAGHSRLRDGCCWTLLAPIQALWGNADKTGCTRKWGASQGARIGPTDEPKQKQERAVGKGCHRDEDLHPHYYDPVPWESLYMGGDKVIDSYGLLSESDELDIVDLFSQKLAPTADAVRGG